MKQRRRKDSFYLKRSINEFDLNSGANVPQVILEFGTNNCSIFGASFLIEIK